MNTKIKGFSLIEVLASVAIVSSLGLAIYKLQLTSLSNSQQIITKQLMLQYTDSLVNQMNTHLNFMGHSNEASMYNDKIYMEPGAYGNLENGYAEKNYNEDETTEAPGNECASGCNDEKFAKYLLKSWKYKLKYQAKLPAANVHAIVCRDGRLNVPSMDNPNCDTSPNSIQPLAIKIVWVNGNESAAETFRKRTDTSDNYILLRVAGR